MNIVYIFLSKTFEQIKQLLLFVQKKLATIVESKKKTIWKMSDKTYFN